MDIDTNPTRWKFHHDTRGYEVADSDAARHGREVMEKKISEMRPSAMDLLRRVHEQQPADRIAYGSKLEFVYADELPEAEPSLLDQVIDAQAEAERQASTGIPALLLSVADQPHVIHPHALGQLAQRARVPKDYLDRLIASPHAPIRKLGQEMLRVHYSAQPENANSRYLLRAVNGELRGVLSDKYRRLDSATLLDTFANACAQVGAVPGEGKYTDTRVEMKAYLPRVFEPVPNEVMMVGLSWKNSDFGNGKHALALTILRVWCTNKATMEDVLGQVHIGKRLDDNLAFSDKTYRLDTEATCSALHDIVTQYLGPEKVNQLMATIRAAHTKGIEWKAAKTALEKVLLKNEMEAARAAFESDDVINLPPGRTAWRGAADHHRRQARERARDRPAGEGAPRGVRRRQGSTAPEARADRRGPAPAVSAAACGGRPRAGPGSERRRPRREGADRQLRGGVGRAHCEGLRRRDAAALAASRAGAEGAAAEVPTVAEGGAPLRLAEQAQGDRGHGDRRAAPGAADVGNDPGEVARRARRVPVEGPLWWGGAARAARVRSRGDHG